MTLGMRAIREVRSRSIVVPTGRFAGWLTQWSEMFNCGEISRRDEHSSLVLIIPAGEHFLTTVLSCRLRRVKELFRDLDDRDIEEAVKFFTALKRVARGWRKAVVPGGELSIRVDMY